MSDRLKQGLEQPARRGLVQSPVVSLSDDTLQARAVKEIQDQDSPLRVGEEIEDFDDIRVLNIAQDFVLLARSRKILLVVHAHDLECDLPFIQQPHGPVHDTHGALADFLAYLKVVGDAAATQAAEGIYGVPDVRQRPLLRQLQLQLLLLLLLLLLEVQPTDRQID
jgi:hypothetical protein